jgi:putative FmdB family regulatory protein
LEERVVPAYDYRCDRCDRTFEVRQRISEAPLTTCDRCGGPIRRLLAAAPFILKGGGWYVTDYPSEGRKKGVEAEKKSSSESTSSTSGSDSAAATTPPPKSGGTSSDAAAATASKPTPTSSS